MSLMSFEQLSNPSGHQNPLVEIRCQVHPSYVSCYRMGHTTHTIAHSPRQRRWHHQERSIQHSSEASLDPLGAFSFTFLKLYHLKP